MEFAPIYLVQRLFYRAWDFFHHWYVDGSRAFGNQFMVTLTVIDQAFAIRITVHHFFEPLYKDYSIIGRILGVVFRTGRILIGAVIYFVVAIAFAAIYLLWLAIPAALLWYIITGII